MGKHGKQHITPGLRIEEIRVGTGGQAERGKTVFGRYDGYLNGGDCFQKNFPFDFKVGQRCVIAGLDRGVEGMKVGGIRRIRVSPHLAYKDKGVPPLIPENAVLIFEVELLAVT